MQSGCGAAEDRAGPRVRFFQRDGAGNATERWPSEGNQQCSGARRARKRLSQFRADNVTADGVFVHPKMQVASLKIARDELNKVIELMERTKWTR
jgi:hypothetical protein